MHLELVTPSPDYLPAYADSLRRGWSLDNIRQKAAADEELLKIETDAAAFDASLDDHEAKGDPITMPDGSTVRRLHAPSPFPHSVIG